ncbi:MAG: exodeoxyribonuclease VII large subunit [Alphaproteobacteria bacterium]|nr:exodeoxyribonuclease VII large subunit [Alphaproteobacteria bacterium]
MNEPPLDLAPQAAPAHNLPEYSVSEISARLKRTVEDAYGRVRVRGEVSRLSRPRSGHLYLSLKDADAVLAAVCWRTTAASLRFVPEDGLEVICSGRITTYPGRSQYQLVIDTVEPAGEGALMALLESRRRKLAAEGLFDEARKRPLPFLPEIIGVVTSPTGAALRDIRHRLADRFPRRLLLWPVTVQGERAASEIAAAINGFNGLPAHGPAPRPDLLIVARGGGSLEDLWAFNEEAVVRAAAAGTIPLISAIGHETDTTLIDHAADRRAPTPTAAAEMAVPVRRELLTAMLGHRRRLLAAIGRRLGEAGTGLKASARGLPDPRQLIETGSQRLDDLDGSLRRALRVAIEGHRRRLAGGVGRLQSAQLRRDFGVREADLGKLAARLPDALGRCLERWRAALDGRTRLLDSLSYERVLDRGYALARDARTGRPVTSARKVAGGRTLGLQFRDGTVPVVAAGEAFGAAPLTARRKTAADDDQGRLF